MDIKKTLDFLNKLKKNNNRDWFAKHKAEYQDHQANMKLFYESVKQNLQSHDEIERLKLFRIYRDVRFSHDKTPYNPHFAGSFSRRGAQLRGGYYLRIRPGESFLAGGFWAPNKEDLFRIRKEFEIDDRELREILSEPRFEKAFGGELFGDEVKTAPKGFRKDLPAIDLIRKKGFVARRQFSDQEVLDENFMNTIDDSYRCLRPFFDYMSEVLTTDLNGVSILE